MRSSATQLYPGFLALPFALATADVELRFPRESYSSLEASGTCSSVHVVTVTFEKAQRELRASPRNPKEFIR